VRRYGRIRFESLRRSRLRTGWLTVREPDLRERLVVAKMNTVISGSPLDETLAAAVIENRDRLLEPHRRLLAAGRAKVADCGGDVGRRALFLDERANASAS